MRSLAILLCYLVLGVGCARDSDTERAPVATSLVYQAPAEAGLRFVVNEDASSNRLLVLKLVTTEPLGLQGLAFVISTTSDKVSWTPPDTARPEDFARVLGLPGATLESRRNGGALEVLVASKGSQGTKFYLGAGTALLELALTLEAGRAPGPIPLGVTQNRALLLPEDHAADLVAVTLRAGELVAR